MVLLNQDGRSLLNLHEAFFFPVSPCHFQNMEKGTGTGAIRVGKGLCRCEFFERDGDTGRTLPHRTCRLSTKVVPLTQDVEESLKVTKVVSKTPTRTRTLLTTVESLLINDTFHACLLHRTGLHKMLQKRLCVNDRSTLASQVRHTTCTSEPRLAGELPKILRILKKGPLATHFAKPEKAFATTSRFAILMCCFLSDGRK